MTGMSMARSTPVRDRAWAWNLQKMASLVLHLGLLADGSDIIAFNLTAINHLMVHNYLVQHHSAGHKLIL